MPPASVSQEGSVLGGCGGRGGHCLGVGFHGHRRSRAGHGGQVRSSLRKTSRGVPRLLDLFQEVLGVQGPRRGHKRVGGLKSGKMKLQVDEKRGECQSTLSGGGGWRGRGKGRSCCSRRKEGSRYQPPAARHSHGPHSPPLIDPSPVNSLHFSATRRARAHSRFDISSCLRFSPLIFVLPKKKDEKKKRKRK